MQNDAVPEHELISLSLSAKVAVQQRLQAPSVFYPADGYYRLVMETLSRRVIG